VTEGGGLADEGEDIEGEVIENIPWRVALWLLPA